MSGRIAEFLGLKKNLAVILGVVVLLEMGEKMAERFLPIYIMALGGGALAVGFLNAMDNLLGALYSFPGGWLSDRLGYKKSLIVFDGVAMLGYAIVLAFPSWQAALAGAVFFISWSAVSLPAVMSAISKLAAPGKRTMGVSLHSLVRRVPMALGPVLGGACIGMWGETDGVRVAFGAAFCLAFAAVFIQQFLLDDVPPGAGGSAINPLAAVLSMSPALKRLLVSDILIRFCEQIPYAFVVVWCMRHAGASALRFGLLSAVEMATAILIYIPVAWLVEKNRSRKPYIAVSFGFFAAFPLVLLHASSAPALVFAFIIRGLKEFGEPTRKALILDLSPEGGKAAAYGAYYMARDTVVAAAALAGGLLWSVSPRANLLTAFVFGAVGTAYFVAYCEE